MIGAGGAPEILQWVTTSVAVVLFLAAAAVHLRGSRDRGTIRTLNDSNAALTESLRLVRVKAAEQEKRIEILEADKVTLVNIATASDQIQQLQEALREHHVEAMTSVENLHGDLTELLTYLRGRQ